jgi:hypothetical protein
VDAFREAIYYQARRLNCVEDIDNMSNLTAVRYLQQKEGYSQCFGGDHPFLPRNSDPSTCDNSGCCWHIACDSYRCSPIIPIDRDQTTITHQEIMQLRSVIGTLETKKEEVLAGGAVGMKIRSFNNLEPTTRKMLIATPTTILGESTDDVSALKPYLLSSGVCESVPGCSEYFNTVLFSADLRSLRAWLSATARFIETNSLAYYPLTKEIHHGVNWGRASCGSGIVYTLSLPVSPPLGSFDALHLGVLDGTVMLTHSEFVPLLAIDLPFLANVTFDDLFQVMSDYPDELCSFRSFLQSKLDDLRNAVIGSEGFSRQCRRLEREIHEQLRKLKSDYKKATIKSAFEMTGCAVASWTLAIYCLLHGSDLLSVLGPGGIAYKMSSAYSEYVVKRLELKENPVYLLWVLGKVASAT